MLNPKPSMALARLARRCFLERPCFVRAASTRSAGRKDDKDAKVKPVIGDGSSQVLRGKTNLFDVVAGLPEWGIGMKFAKKTWRADKCYTLTRINLYKSGNHGKAWGVYNEGGVVKTGRVRRIGGVNKRKWFVLEKPSPVPVPWKTISDLEPGRVEKKRRKQHKMYANHKAKKKAQAEAQAEAAKKNAQEQEAPEVPPEVNETPA